MSNGGVSNGNLTAAAALRQHQIDPGLSDLAAFPRNVLVYRVRTDSGTGLDLATAYREGAFGDQASPFTVWLMLLEDAPGSRRPISDRSPNFALFPEFSGASYADRYHILCRKMMHEKLYDAAALVLSPCGAGETGDFSQLDEMTSLKTFITELAAHVAAAVVSGHE